MATASLEMTNNVGARSKPPPLQVQINENATAVTADPSSSSAGDCNGPQDGLEGSVKTPTTPGPGVTGRSESQQYDGLPTGGRGKHDKKIGHRRVDPQGQVTYKKMPTSEIMGSIQLAISNSVGSLASKPERDLLMQDFAVVESVYFARDGGDKTPSHSYSDFRFKTYAPIAFRYFRELFRIQPEDYLSSLCNYPMIELSNPGASGSVFYMTSDDQFIVKTIQHKEADFLQKLLPGYYMNLNQNPRTLLPKFFGLYCYQVLSKNIRLLVMNNLLPSTIRMHQKYDLKGSTYKRRASKHERAKPTPTLKDLDFFEDHPEGIYLEGPHYDALMKTMNRDCLVLESFKIMDYSFLVGIHNIDQAAREREAFKDQGTSDECMLAQSESFDNGIAGPSAQGNKNAEPLYSQKRVPRNKAIFSNVMESIQAEALPVDLSEEYPTGGIPARNAKGERLLLFLGIIDILQSYRLLKKLEHTWKSVLHDGDTISVHRPSFYAQRFQDFMRDKVFKKILSLDLPEFRGPHHKFRSLVASYLVSSHAPGGKTKLGGATLRLLRRPSAGKNLRTSECILFDANGRPLNEEVAVVEAAVDEEVGRKTTANSTNDAVPTELTDDSTNLTTDNKQTALKHSPSRKRTKERRTAASAAAAASGITAAATVIDGTRPRQRVSISDETPAAAPRPDLVPSTSEEKERRSDGSVSPDRVAAITAVRGGSGRRRLQFDSARKVSLTRQEAMFDNEAPGSSREVKKMERLFASSPDRTQQRTSSIHSRSTVESKRMSGDDSITNKEPSRTVEMDKSKFFNLEYGTLV